MTLAPLPLPPLPKTPLVSVLVSCYNYEPYVVAAVESALAQTWTPVEVVVVDDGSTDGSAERVRQRFGADARVRLLSQANAGQAAAMNAAVAAARGEVLCFLDADDLFEPDKCARVVAALREQPEAGFLVHGLTLVDADDRPVGRQTALPEAGWQAEAVLRRGGAVPAVPPTSALVLRRAVAEVLFPLDTSFQIASDALIQRAAPLVTAIAALPRPLMRYRVHGANHFAETAMTAAGVDRMIRVAEVGRAQQRAFLADRYGPGVAGRLAGFDADPGWLGLQTHRAFLAGDAGAFRRAVRALAAHPRSAHDQIGRTARLAALLPARLGRAVWAVVFGAGPHKRLLRALRRLRP